MSTNFRPAAPDDAQFLGWVIFMAARGHLKRGWFDIVLQRPIEFGVSFCARLSNARAKSWWHQSFFTLAEVDGQPASGACAFPESAPYMVSGEALADASDAMGIGKAERERLWPRGAFIMSTTSGEDDCWTIENVATWPEYRGRGIAETLIQHMIGEMGEPTRAQISFLIGNEVAEKCYHACGFEFAEDRLARDLEAAMGVPGIRRLARAV